MEAQKNRQIELDLLRIIAMFAVVMVHVCGMKTHELSLDDSNWKVLTFIAGIMTWQIPVFVMISGRFFLDPKRSITSAKVVNSIIRLIISFIFWDFFYQIYYILSGTYSNLNWRGILSQAVMGPYHFWYIYMLIGIYALIPFLRKITQNKKIMEYFIALFIAFEFLTNYGVRLPFIGKTIEVLLGYMNFNFSLGYAGYFVAGYYFYKYEISYRKEIVLYIIGIFFLFGAAGLTVWKSVTFGIHEDWFTAYLMPNVAIESFAVYTFFVKRVSKLEFNIFIKKVIEKISRFSFGIYLIHALVLFFLGYIGLSPILASPFVMVPLIAILVILICGFIIYFVQKIPYIGEKIS